MLSAIDQDRIEAAVEPQVDAWYGRAQILYGVAGERRVLEMELDWLPGYAGSAPVRVGFLIAGTGLVIVAILSV